MPLSLPFKPTSPCLIIIRGIPGSGKSTLALQLLKSMPNAVHCEADHFFINKQGQYNYDRTKIKLAHQYCQQNVRKALQQGLPVIVSNTTIKLWELMALLDIAADYAIDTHVIKCCGEYANNHNVPVDIVAKMAMNYQSYSDEVCYTPG